MNSALAVSTLGMICGVGYSWACSSAESEEEKITTKEIRISLAGINDDARDYLKKQGESDKEFGEGIGLLTEAINLGTKELKSAHVDLSYWTAIANKPAWDQRADFTWNRGPTNFFCVQWNGVPKGLISSNAEKRDRLKSRVAEIEVFLGYVAEAARLLKHIYNDRKNKTMDGEKARQFKSMVIEIEEKFKNMQSSACAAMSEFSRPSRWQRYWMNYAVVGCFMFGCGKKFVEMHRSGKLVPLVLEVLEKVSSSIQNHIVEPINELYQKLAMIYSKNEIISEMTLKESQETLELMIQEWHTKKFKEPVENPVVYTGMEKLMKSYKEQVKEV